MRKFMVMAGLVVVAVACRSGADMLGEILDSGVPDAGAESPGDGTTMQYVGNSTKTFNGTTFDSEADPAAQGIYTYYAACQETFGPGHRMCTQDEIIFTTKLPPLSEGSAWYDPRSTCASAKRFAVNNHGNFLSETCYDGTQYERPIACCGPK